MPELGVGWTIGDVSPNGFESLRFSMWGAAHFCGLKAKSLGSSGAKGDYALMLGRICPEKGNHLALDAARAAGVPLLIAGRVFPYPEHERYFEQELRPRLDRERRFIGPVAMPAKARLLRQSMESH